MGVKPLADRVLVERIEDEEQKSVGGIIIPDTAKEKPQQGKVIAVGPGKMTDDGKRIAMEVKPGQKVLFGKYSGSDIKIDGKEMLIMREDDILGIID
ncbi:MAG: co-chaperone GroES [Candidatus Sumerlaeota bacterium]|nr:co-chaperone GroES [Candidatus Sumerlaeota bacterium]